MISYLYTGSEMIFRRLVFLKNLTLCSIIYPVNDRVKILFNHHKERLKFGHLRSRWPDFSADTSSGTVLFA